MPIKEPKGAAAYSVRFQNKEADTQLYRKRYPKNVDLHPDSKDHKILLDYLLDIAFISGQTMEKRYPSWKAVDEKLTAYIKLDDEEEAVRSDDSRKPVSMVVPMGFAMRETLMAYNVATFLRDPIFRYDPKGPEDTIAAILLEMYVNQSVTDPLSRTSLNMFTALQDSVTYGFGGLTAEWKTVRGFKTTRAQGETFRQDIDLFKGPASTAFDTYAVLPDTSVPITEVADMQHFGWVVRKNLSTWLGNEEQDESLFNLQYLKGSSIGESTFFQGDTSKSGRYAKTGDPFDFKGFAPYKHTVDLMFYYCWLIPRDFGIGQETYPRLWKFGVAGDRVIVQAYEVTLNHNRIPVTCIAPTGDQHTVLPVSLLEIDHPMQVAMDWTWSSHVANVRKIIHNMLVVDPEIINIADVVDTTWGMVARVRPSHWGRGVKDGIAQLPVADATRNHPNDVAFMMELSDRIMGVNDSAKGFQQRRGERVSALEAGNTFSSLLARLESRAALMSMQGIADLAFMFASDVNQFLDEETYVRNMGEWKTILQSEYGITEEFVKINPNEIDLTAAVKVNDGSTPRSDMAQLGVQLMQVAQQNPQLIQQLDSVRLFLQIARNAGFRNPEQFIASRTLNSQEEEGLDNSVRQGNTVPVDEYIGATNGATTGA